MRRHKVSEEPAVSIFKVEEPSKRGSVTTKNQGVTFRKSDSEVGHPLVLFPGQSTKL